MDISKIFYFLCFRRIIKTLLFIDYNLLRFVNMATKYKQPVKGPGKKKI